MKRRKLSETRRLVTIGRDKSRCCNEELRQRRIYPFQLACPKCNKDIEYEDEVIFVLKDIGHLVAKILQLKQPMHYATGEIMGYSCSQVSFSEDEIKEMEEYMEARKWS